MLNKECLAFTLPCSLLPHAPTHIHHAALEKWIFYLCPFSLLRTSDQNKCIANKANGTVRLKLLTRQMQKTWESFFNPFISLVSGIPHRVLVSTYQKRGTEMQRGWPIGQRDELVATWHLAKKLTCRAQGGCKKKKA